MFGIYYDVYLFKQVLSAYEFEVHAGSKTRHPNNHIYLENGKPIYSIVEELRSAPLSTIDDVIRAVAGSSVNEEYFQAWKGNMPILFPVVLEFSVLDTRMSFFIRD